MLSVALVVPPPWSTAADALAAVLAESFPDLPPLVAPHVSLRQSFRASDPIHAARAVRRALQHMRPGMIAVGGVGSFLAADSAVEVVYIAVAGAWLTLAHQRVLRETEPIAEPPSPGEPAFELEGFRPHLTVAMPRDLAEPPERRASVLNQAIALWPRLRPSGDGFRAEEVTLSRWRADGAGEILARVVLA
jgi:2'-5' RNA ligase